MKVIKAASSTSVTKSNFVIINQDISSNALGRSLSMAMVAREIGETKVLSFGRGNLWPGATQFDIPVFRMSRSWKRDLDAQLAVPGSRQSVVWLSKGLDPLSRVATYVRRSYPESIIVLDLDDDDAGLADAFRRSSRINCLKLSWFRRGNPWRIRRSQDVIASVADGFTFSTKALASVYPASYLPHVRIPHVRSLISAHERQDSIGTRGVRFGCFGTLRPHKGSQLLLDLMRSDRSLTLVTFRDCGLGSPSTEDANWIEIDPTTPIQEAYNRVDVALIPITDVGSGAQFQLPAKIVDAMRCNVPTVATLTPAIAEIAGGVITPLPPDLTLSEVKKIIIGASKSEDSGSAGIRFRELLTPSAAALELEALLREAKKH